MRSKLFDISEFQIGRIQSIYSELLGLTSPVGATLGKALRMGFPQNLSGDLVPLAENYFAELSSKIIVTFGDSGQSSCETLAGVVTSLELNMKGILLKTERQRVDEYQAFAADPEIGSIHIVTEDDAIMVTLAHEISHAIAARRAQSETPHGETWRSIYRFIRQSLNQYIASRADVYGREETFQVEKRVLRKLKSLHSMASHQSSNEHEAERAQVQLDALLSRYRINLTELHACHAPKIVQKYAPLTRVDRRWTLSPSLPRVVAGVCQCRSLKHTRRLGKGAGLSHYVSFIGSVDDVERAVYLLEVIERAVRTDLKAFAESDDCLALPGRERYNARASFHQGMLRAIIERLWALEEENELTIELADAATRSLVVSRANQLDEAMGRLYPKLSRRSQPSGRSQTGTNEAARKVGTRSGKRVNLNNPLTKNRAGSIGLNRSVNPD
jgi:hypothetical protein